MANFRIMPHSRLQEWVAEEKGYFRDEGLDYEFITPDLIGRFRNPDIESEEGGPAEVKRGAYESMEAGRACEVSSACHWAVNMAAHTESGRMTSWEVPLSCLPPPSPRTSTPLPSAMAASRVRNNFLENPRPVCRSWDKLLLKEHLEGATSRPEARSAWLPAVFGPGCGPPPPRCPLQ